MPRCAGGDPLTGAHRQYLRDGTPRSSRPLAAAPGRPPAAMKDACLASQLGCHLSGGEITRPTGVGRPVAVLQPDVPSDSNGSVAAAQRNQTSPSSTSVPFADL
jgi:hypothetical protein